MNDQGGAGRKADLLIQIVRACADSSGGRHAPGSCVLQQGDRIRPLRISCYGMLERDSRVEGNQQELSRLRPILGQQLKKRFTDQLYATSNMRLLEHAANMRTDRRRRDPELLGDLYRRVAKAHER